MTKFYLESIRCLPKKYLRDGTNVVEVTMGFGTVVALHKDLPPIQIFPNSKRWRKVRFFPSIETPGLTSP